MTVARLRIGLVGVGPWGRHILRDLKGLGAEVQACTLSEASVERAKQGGADGIVRTLADLPACDGYVVAWRTSAHLDAVEALLPRGKPIYVEKPLSNDLDRIKRLPAVATDLVFTMHKWRYHPGILELRRIVETQEFGLPIGMFSSRLGPENHHHDVAAVWTLLPHDLSIFLHVLNGMPRLEAAWQDPLTPHDGLIVRCRVGEVACVAEVSSGHVAKHRAVVLRCREAVCQIDDDDYGHVQIRRRVGGAFQTEIRAVGDAMPLHEELAAFCRHVQGGAPPMTHLAEETAIVSLIDQAIRQAV